MILVVEIMLDTSNVPSDETDHGWASRKTVETSGRPSEPLEHDAAMIVAVAFS